MEATTSGSSSSLFNEGKDALLVFRGADDQERILWFNLDLTIRE
jgi:hypothetical protein